MKWINENILKHLHIHDNLLKKAKGTQNCDDWASYRKSRNYVVKLIRESKMEYYSGIFEEKSSKTVWKSIKLLTGTSKSQSAITNMKIGDSLTDDKQNIVEDLNNYFVGVADQLRELLLDIPFDISKLASFIELTPRRNAVHTLVFPL